jgi:hypothetical protein
MAFRTIHTWGTVAGDTAAVVKVGKTIIHAGPLCSGLLFEFITDVTLHGKVSVTIEVLYGTLMITHNRVTYPALIKGIHGFVNMPQPINQPNLPLTVDSVVTYDHYMFNGPAQWIVDTDVANRVVVVDDFFNAVSTDFIIPDWQYNQKPFDVSTITESGIKNYWYKLVRKVTGQSNRV